MNRTCSLLGIAIVVAQSCLSLGAKEGVQMEPPGALPVLLGDSSGGVAGVLSRIETSTSYRFDVYGKALRGVSEAAAVQKKQLVDFLVYGIQYPDIRGRIMATLVGPHIGSDDFSPQARSALLSAYQLINQPYIFWKLAGVLEAPVDTVIKVIPTQSVEDSADPLSRMREEIVYFSSYDWGRLLYGARMGRADAANAILRVVKERGEGALRNPDIIGDLAYTKNPILIKFLEGILLNDTRPTIFSDDLIMESPAALAAAALNYWVGYPRKSSSYERVDDSELGEMRRLLVAKNNEAGAVSPMVPIRDRVERKNEKTDEVSVKKSDSGWALVYLAALCVALISLVGLFFYKKLKSPNCDN